MNKIEEYRKLIFKRKSWVSLPFGLSNYKETGFEIEHVDAWELWHSNLDADIMIIGQDFADAQTFIKDKGLVEPQSDKYAYATNKNLATLFEMGLGIQIGHPLNPNMKVKLFFTNAIIGLKKEGGMQGKVKEEWLKKSVEEFLSPLINLVQPKVIICLGKLATKAVDTAFNHRLNPKINLSHSLINMVGKSFDSTEGIKIFPVYHCGARVININRSLNKQLGDWMAIRTVIESK
jgi:uracil-DNA glycosylase